MKGPFKTGGRELGLIKCNPWRNCKRFHMTRFQPHPDTEDPGLFRECWHSGRSQMSVSIAGAVGGQHYLCYCRGGAELDVLVRSAGLCVSDACPRSSRTVLDGHRRGVKYSPGELLSSRRCSCVLRIRGTILLALTILMIILLIAKTGNIFRLLGCFMRS